MSVTYKYGIDFGTTNSSIALVMQDLDDNKYTKVFEIDRTMHPFEIIRSVVGYKDNEIFVGERGLSYLTGIGDNPVKQVKMILLTAEKDVVVTRINDREIYCSDVMAEILKEMKKEADVQKKGCEITGVVMGVPNGTKECVKSVYITALVKAGYFRNLDEAVANTDFLEESIAVALFYGSKRGLNAKKALIFDFGGGTLDMAVVDLKAQSLNDTNITPHEVIKKGEKSGAGERFTSLLFSEVFVPAYADKYFGGNKYNVSKMFYELGVDSSKNISSLWENMLEKGGPVWSFIKELDKAKIALSTREFYDFYLYFDETEEHDEVEFKTVTLKRSDFEKAIKQDLISIGKVINSMLKEGFPVFNENDIDVVLLAGGSSMIPCVREMLIDKFGASKVHYDDKFTGGTYINVMTCISQGLAYAGYSNKEYIKDITSFDYGYMDAGTNSIDVVIPTGTRFDDALFIGDVSRQEFTREIEAVNPSESKFFIDIYEGKNQIMKLRFSKGGHSGQYKLFFSIEPKKGALRIDVYDSLYGGWVDDLSESDRMYRIPKK